MSLLELLWIGQRNRNLRLPLLLGRLHLALIFSGPSSASGRKSNDNRTLRSFLFIAAILITKCGSSSFPNKTKSVEGTNISSHISHSTYAITSSKSLDGDYQDFPLEHHLFHLHKKRNHLASSEEQYVDGQETDPDLEPKDFKTIGYFLKGLILPMLISLTLSFGFIIYKNRVKRARLQAIQNALEEARHNPNHLLNYRPDGLLNPGGSGFVSSALLSFIDSRDEWSLVTGNEGPLLEADDYIGEGGETARHKPYIYDLPPDYAAVFDPPTYEEATSSNLSQFQSNAHKDADNAGDLQVVCSSDAIASSAQGQDNLCEFEEDDEGKHLMSSQFHKTQ